MNFIQFESAEKLRGGFYTAPDVAAFLAGWVLESKPSRVLEPSCGDGALLSALASLAGHSMSLRAWEVDPAEAAKARQRVPAGDVDLQVTEGDFLKWFLWHGNQERRFDAAVGNPPFIRYQYLPEEQQFLAEKIFARFGLPFTRHTNAWVPFVMATLSLLAPGGRLAFVVPAELLHIAHARSLRHYLIAECARILVLDPEELWFDDALQGVVLLLAQKKDSAKDSGGALAIQAVGSRDVLRQSAVEVFERAEFVPADETENKWMRHLLSKPERRLLESLADHRCVREFSDLADVDVGIVTGANKFFLVPDEVVAKFQLQRWAHPMFGRSEHVQGLIYTSDDHQANRRAGLPANFLWFDDVTPDAFPAMVQGYLAAGVEQGLPGRFKCRVRDPWYRVPSVYPSPVAMLKRAHHYPRLILNAASAYTTDTAYRIRPKGDSGTNIVYAFLNSLTCLGAELEGRHYGGGVLELVPSEIERLLIPDLPVQPRQLEDLDRQFRARRDPAELLQQQDELVLEPIGLSRADAATLHAAWNRLRCRRQRDSNHAEAESP